MGAVESTKIFTLMGSICSKHIKFWMKKYEELCLMKLKRDAKFDKKLALGSKNDTKNLVNFNV